MECVWDSAVDRITSTYALVPIAGAIFIGFLCISQVLKHRSHLGQCSQWLIRLQRLDNRLSACVTELNTLVPATPAPAKGILPESLAGHLHYLRVMRTECDDLAAEVATHRRRLSWHEGYLARITPVGARCEDAHRAIGDACAQLAAACRRYEKAAVVEMRAGRGNRAGVSARRDVPVSLLRTPDAHALRRLRLDFESSINQLHDLTGLRLNLRWESRWLIYVSEIRIEDDLYRGDVRPMLRTGMGDSYATHLDAR